MGIYAKIEGGEKLQRQLKRLDRRVARQIPKKIVRDNMRPILREARQIVPVASGRLKASLGLVGTSRPSRGVFTARVGTRRDFSFTASGGDRRAVGRGRRVDAAVAKGATLDKGGHPNQYAGGIEFGTKKDGRVARRKGGAYFLNQPMRDNTQPMIARVARDFDRAIRQAT